MPPNGEGLTRSAPGLLEAIWLKRAHRAPMVPVETAVLVPDHGMAGGVDRSRRRQVTVLGAEGWQAALAEIGGEVDPGARRANLYIRGLQFTRTRGRVLRVGSCRLSVGGELTPCERMDEALPGLRQALTPGWRGGVFTQVLTGGTIRVGDLVEWAEP